MNETEQVFRADMVLIALGFTGPEKVLSRSLGVDTVSSILLIVVINIL